MFHNASESPRLTKEQEHALARRVLAGDLEARNELVEHNYGLVASLASNYLSSGISFDDLFQEGCIGLIEAANRFDPEKNTRFSTYATPWIKKYITRASVRSGFPVRIPRRLEPYVNKVLSFVRYFEMTEGKEPSIEEISESTGVSQEIVQDTLFFCCPTSRYRDVSAYLYGSDEEADPQDEGQCITSDLMKQNLRRILDLVLTEAELRVIDGLFFGNERISERTLASFLQMTPSSLNKTKYRAFQKIEAYFERHGIDYRDFFPES